MNGGELFRFSFIALSLLPLLSIGAPWTAASCASPKTTEKHEIAPPAAGTISGRVIDDRAEPAAYSAIVLLNQGTLANKEGRYTLTGVPAGDHWVTAGGIPCHLPDRRQVRIEPGSKVEVNFRLEWSYDYQCPCDPDVDRNRLRRVEEKAWICE